MEEKLACVRFNNVGKSYYFSTDLDIKKGEKVNANINPEQILDVESSLIVIANTAKLSKLK